MEHPAAHFAILLHNERLRESLIAEARQPPLRPRRPLQIRTRVSGALRALAAAIEPKPRVGWDADPVTTAERA